MKYLKGYNEENSKNIPNFKKIIIDDFVVYQGKDATSNDYVTLELGNDPNDIFLHAKGVPGSHVIIKVKDKIPTKDVIQKAAQIAAKNSKSKEERVKVVYCKKKFVTKEKGSNPGQVKLDYINSDEIFITKN
jgi:predicted ribosome quality control (RQC) complex YloA/Tae2 family protein